MKKAVVLLVVLAVFVVVLSIARNQPPNAPPPAPVVDASYKMLPGERENKIGRVLLPGQYNGTLSLIRERDVDDTEEMNFKIINGVASIPVGTYQFNVVNIEKTFNKKPWYAYGYSYYLDKPIKLKVHASDNKLEFGPPLTASIEINNEDPKSPYFELKMKDAAGVPYSVSGDTDYETKMQVLDRSGKVIWEEPMEAG